MLPQSNHSLINHNLHRPAAFSTRQPLAVGGGPVTRSRALVNPSSNSSRNIDDLISKECAKRNRQLKARSRQGSADSQTSQDSVSSCKSVSIKKNTCYNDDKENIPPHGKLSASLQAQQQHVRTDGSLTPAHAVIGDHHAFLER